VGSAPGGILVPLRGGRVVCMSVIFILNEIWTQHETYFGRHFALLTIYHLVPGLTPHYKQHILSPTKVIKVRCSLK
jgi:hypothetical protein